MPWPSQLEIEHVHSNTIFNFNTEKGFKGTVKEK